MRPFVTSLALLLLAAAPLAAAQTITGPRLSYWSFDGGEIAPGGLYSGNGGAIDRVPTDDPAGTPDQANAFTFSMGGPGSFAGFWVDKAGVEDIGGTQFLIFQLRADVQPINLPLVLEVNLQEDGDGGATGFDFGGVDDEFQALYSVTGSVGYQEVAIPLAAFTDDNSAFEGANDGFDFTRLDRVAIAVIGGDPTPFTLSFDEFAFGSQTVADRFTDLTAAVEALGPDGDGTLNRGNTNALTSKLGAAGRKHARGQDPSGPLGAFRNQLAALTPQRLSPAQRDALLADLDALEAAIAAEAPAAASARGGRATVVEAALSAPVPNPTTGRATLAFELAEAADARLAVYDALGREVAVLVDGALDAGRHTATFDGAGLPTGTYVARLSTGSRVETRRVTVVR